MIVKVKNSIIQDALHVLDNVRIINSMNKQLKNALVHNYIELRKTINGINDDLEEQVSKFNLDWKDQIVQVNYLRSLNKEIGDEYSEFLQEESKINELLSNINSEKSEINIIPIEIDDFMSNLSEDEFPLMLFGSLIDCRILN